MKHLYAFYAITIATLAAPLTALAQRGWTPLPYNNMGGSFTGGVNQLIAPGPSGGFITGGDYRTFPGGGTGFNSLILLAQRLIGYFQVIIFIVAIFMALYGALRIVIKGDFEEGRKYLLYSFFGAVIAILSFAVIPLACFVTGANNSTCYIGQY